MASRHYRQQFIPTSPIRLRPSSPTGIYRFYGFQISFSIRRHNNTYTGFVWFPCNLCPFGNRLRCILVRQNINENYQTVRQPNDNFLFENECLEKNLLSPLPLCSVPCVLLPDPEWRTRGYNGVVWSQTWKWQRFIVNYKSNVYNTYDRETSRIKYNVLWFVLLYCNEYFIDVIQK